MTNYKSLTTIRRAVQSRGHFCRAVFLLTFVVYITILHFDQKFNIYRAMSNTCRGTLELPQEEIIKKVSSYHFPGTERYIQDLFPSFDVPEKMPDFPRFVTAVSSNHFKEGMRMIVSLYAMLGKRYPIKLYVYDIGLSKQEQKRIQEVCNCTFRKFPFDKYPEHVGILKNYAWKPIIIQLMLREYPFVVWMDASTRFTTTNIDPILEMAKRKRFVSALAPDSVHKVTKLQMFETLKEEPCLFRDLKVAGARFIILYPSAYEMKYLLKPWVSCALLVGCIATFDDPHLHSKCFTNEDFGCHRFDQSALSILMHRLYHKNALEHVLRHPIRELVKRCENCGLDDTKQYLEGSKAQL